MATALGDRSHQKGPTPPPSAPLASSPLAARRAVVLADDACEAALPGADPEYAGIYLHARYFDPKLGQFLSPDPLRTRGGPNLYAYGRGNPSNLSDRGGLTPVCIQQGPNGCEVWLEDPVTNDTEWWQEQCDPLQHLGCDPTGRPWDADDCKRYGDCDDNDDLRPDDGSAPSGVPVGTNEPTSQPLQIISLPRFEAAKGKARAALAAAIARLMDLENHVACGLIGDGYLDVNIQFPLLPFVIPVGNVPIPAAIAFSGGLQLARDGVLPYAGGALMILPGPSVSFQGSEQQAAPGLMYGAGVAGVPTLVGVGPSAQVGITPAQGGQPGGFYGEHGLTFGTGGAAVAAAYVFPKIPARVHTGRCK